MPPDHPTISTDPCKPSNSGNSGNSSSGPACHSTRIARVLAAVVFAAGSLAPLAAPAAEEIYRWVDAAGTVHYTQVAPQGIAFERVTPGNRERPGTLANPRSPSSAAAGSATTRSQAPESRDADSADGSAALTETQQRLKRELEQEAQERLAEVQATRRDNCEKAREQFREFTTFARIRVSDGQGGARVLTEEERQQRIDEAQEAIVLNCDDSG